MKISNDQQATPFILVYPHHLKNPPSGPTDTKFLIGPRNSPPGINLSFGSFKNDEGILLLRFTGSVDTLFDRIDRC